MLPRTLSAARSLTSIAERGRTHSNSPAPARMRERHGGGAEGSSHSDALSRLCSRHRGASMPQECSASNVLRGRKRTSFSDAPSTMHNASELAVCPGNLVIDVNANYVHDAAWIWRSRHEMRNRGRV